MFRYFLWSLFFFKLPIFTLSSHIKLHLYIVCLFILHIQRSTNDGQTFVSQSSKFPLGTLLHYTFYKIPNSRTVSLTLLFCAYVTGFVKRGLPHTSNFMYLKDRNFFLICDMNLKVSHNVLLYFSLLYTKF